MNMADTFSASSAEESQEANTSASSSRYKATNMAFEEMVEMVDILQREDYDGENGPYPRPNLRKDKILTTIVSTLEQKFGVRRGKDQLRKRWSDIKSREHDQYRRIRKAIKKRGKRLRRQSEPTRTSRPHQTNWAVSPSPRVDVAEQVVEVDQICTPPSDADLFVERQAAEPFTTDSAHRLIGQIMAWNLQLENMQKEMATMQQGMKDMIDVLGRI